MLIFIIFSTYKGLTEAEIKQAFKSADVQEVNNVTADTSDNSSEYIVSKIQDNKKVIRNNSIWWKIFRWIRNILVAGCLSYTAYTILIKVMLSK